MPEGTKTIAQNKKAWHDFFIEETYEAGLVLCGTEVKSIRLGRVNLKDCYAGVHDNEVFVYNMHVSPYDHGNIFNVDPLRTRKLLLNKREILKLTAAIKQDGYSLIPLSLYFKRGRIKMELAVAKGKKLYDKRAALAEKDAKREIERNERGK